jgi:hypothetical protein
VHGGWTQLLGAAYERRIYAFRFETTEAQDDALIEKLNARRTGPGSICSSTTARISRG